MKKKTHTRKRERQQLIILISQKGDVSIILTLLRMKVLQPLFTNHVRAGEVKLKNLSSS